MAIGYDPFRELDQLAQQLMSGGRSPRSFPMDAYRRGDDFFVHLDLPGVDPGSIDITVEGNTLTVRAERTLRGQDNQWLAQERPSGSFMRQLTLGEGLDIDAVHAQYDNGVLALTIPTAREATARKVQVTSSSGEQQQIGQSDETVHGEVTHDSSAE